MAPEDLERGIVAVAQELLALGVVAVHDPGHVSPDPELGFSFPAYARLSETGRLPIRVHASIRDDALATALAGGLRSGDVLGADPDGRARIGWQKCYADGSLGSRTAALLADIEPEPDRPLPPERRRGVWMTEPEALRDLVDRAAAGGIATQIHAIGDAAVRAALDALEPTAGRLPFMPRIEHLQLVDPADRPRFAAAGIAASVQPVHLRSDAAQARRLWGDRAERNGYTWGSLAATGAVLAFGTDAPVEPFDPWPGIALAVRREDPTLAGRDARLRPGRGALDRAGVARRMRGPGGHRRRTGSRPADRRPARRRRGHPRGGRRRPGRDRTERWPRSARRSCSSTAGSSTSARASASGIPRRRARASASANSPLKMREVDGKAWIVSARTSIVTWALIATTHSWIAAEASGQAIAAPTSSRVRAVDDDRHVAELGLDRVALGARREVGDELERVEARRRAPPRAVTPTDDASGSV